MKFERHRQLAAWVFAAWLASLSGPAQADIAFGFVSAEKARDLVAGPKAPDSLAEDGTFSMSLRKRTASSHVEKHMGWNEELVIQEGNVLLNYGGAATNIRETGPGEFNGDTIAGGKSVIMHPGDIVVIPAGTWHEEVLRSPVMRYILFNTKNGSSAGK
jgi:mannose-6-phosphate isomerase-like protein (cupin superfamily)